LADIPHQSQGGDRSVRLFHRTDAELPGVVLLLRHRARTAEDSTLQRDATPDCGMGRPAAARGLSRSGPVSLLRGSMPKWSPSYVEQV
jgi:hypothetical protein